MHLREHLRVAILFCCTARGASLNADVTAHLQQRVGLTRREADLVQHRHRKLTKRLLEVAEIDATIDVLPKALLPGHVAELLRSTGLATLRDMASDSAHSRWCSYKKNFWCGCVTSTTHAAEDADDSAPALLAIDCEFKPLRCAAVDGDGVVVIDHLVVPDEPRAGTSEPPLPSILRCDRPLLRTMTAGVLRERLRGYLAAGTTLVAHTPQSDLRALGFEQAEWQEVLPRGVVDVATMRLEEGAQVASLRRMALAHLDLGEGSRFQAGGGKHCAIEDAHMTLRVYRALLAERSDA